METKNPDDRKTNITPEELVVLDDLVDAWNMFVELPNSRPDDVTDFRRAIHEAQRILSQRIMRRVEPGLFGG